MSHFVVVVIGEDVDGQLAPYDEQIECEPVSQGTVSQDDLDYFEKYYRENEPKETEGLTFDELYEKFGESWNGGNWVKNEDGTYEEFSTYNPDSKWDWYVVGGRWSGYFKLKPGADGEVGEPGVFGNTAPEQTADIVLKKDVDFEGMMNESGESAGKKYDLVFEAIKDTPINESWDVIRDRSVDIDIARTSYGEQPRVEAFKALTQTEIGRETFGWSESVDDYNVDRETFVQRARNRAISPFAIVKDGEWYEKGRMGWFGMSTDEMSQDEWNQKVVELFESVPEDTVFTAVDCHI
jgi:hypothetical protein